MLRIRFHGRGGHGAKTASRIVGSAAFLAGHHAQDSPIYGAERRGAPIAAFTRISDGPIRERGMIETPDLIVVADETLVADPLAGVLRGQEAASAIFVNTQSPEAITAVADLEPPLFTFDITTRTLHELGQASALSAGMAAAAACLCGLIEEEHLLEAAREEFEEFGFDDELIAHNLAILHDVYESLEPVEFTPHAYVIEDSVTRPEYEDPERGAPSILHPGNAELKKTGDWRVEQPVIDLDGCTKCGLCVIYCPDGAIALNRAGQPVIDYDHCKGCMICREICPPHVIKTEKEVTAW